MANGTGARLFAVIEHLADGPEAVSGGALARAVEAHPALAPLLDFYSVDPAQIAVEVGMVFPHEEDGMDDLADLDLGEREWFEPSAGLAAVRRAQRALREDPQSLAAAIYDPDLRAADVLLDLDAIERTLMLAQQREARFHLALAH